MDQQSKTGRMKRLMVWGLWLGLWACQGAPMGNPAEMGQRVELINAGHYAYLTYLHHPFSGEAARRDTVLPAQADARLLLVELQIGSEGAQPKSFPPACLCRQSSDGEYWYAYRPVRSPNRDWHTADSLVPLAGQVAYRKNYIFELAAGDKGKLFLVPYCPEGASKRPLNRYFSIRLGDVDSLERDR
jgi:hypothetical protein